MHRKFSIVALTVLVIISFTASAWATGMTGTTRSLIQSLFFAIAENNVEALVVARDKGTDMNVTLLEAGLDPEKVFGASISELLKTDAALDTWPVLTWAVYFQNEDMIRILIKSGAYTNAVDGAGATPMHWAAWTGNYPIVKMLLENGSNPYIADAYGRIPLDWAILTGQTDIIRLLPPKKPALDTDKDGVPDYMDQCPNTPLGADVDERGCWIAAYANFFDFNKAIIKSQYRPHLVRTAQIIQQHEGLKVKIVGHTDSVGSQQYNLDLGQRRAEAVMNFLIENGVEADRLKAESMGEMKPIATNATSKGRAKNRRVEIHIWEHE